MEEKKIVENLRLMRRKVTSEELDYIDVIRDTLINRLFDSKDKRYTIKQALKEVYLKGKEQSKSIIMGDDIKDGLKVTFKKAIGIFSATSRGNPLSVERINGRAMIPFLGKYVGMEVVVIVNDKEEKNGRKNSSGNGKKGRSTRGNTGTGREESA